MLELFKIVGRIALEGHDAVTAGLDKVDRKASDSAAQLRKTGEAMERFGRRTTSAGKSLSKFVTGPIAAVGAATFAFTNKVADMGDRVAKTARQTGLSVEAFQEMEFALGQLTQMADGDIERALGRLNTRIGQAAEGRTKYVDALQAIGFSLEDIESGAITSEQAFNQFLTAVQNTSSDTEAAAMAAELFGERVGRQMGPALRSGGADVDALRQKFRDLGLGISGEAAAASEKFNDKMDILKRQFQAVAVEVGSKLMPIMMQFMDWLQANAVPVVEAVVGVVGTLAEMFGALPGPVQQTIGVVVGLAAALGPLLIIVGKVITIAGSAVKAFAALKVAVIALQVAAAPALAALAPFIAIGAAVAAAVYLVVTRVNEFVQAFGGWKAVLTSLLELIESLWTTIKETMAQILEKVAQVVAQAVEYWANLGKQLLEATVQWVTGLVESISQFATKVSKAFMQLVTQVIEYWTNLANRLLEATRQMVVALVEAIATMAQQVVQYFVNMGKNVLKAIANMVKNAVRYVSNMVSNILGKLKNLYTQAVGNSIIPDMANGILGEFAGMRDGTIKDTDDMVKGVNGRLEGLHDKVAPSIEAEGSAGGGRGGFGSAGGSTVVDMRHAVIRDDRDMLDRMRRRGLEMSGAF